MRCTRVWVKCKHHTLRMDMLSATFSCPNNHQTIIKMAYSLIFIQTCKRTKVSLSTYMNMSSNTNNYMLVLFAHSSYNLMLSTNLSLGQPNFNIHKIIMMYMYYNTYFNLQILCRLLYQFSIMDIIVIIQIENWRSIKMLVQSPNIS